MTREQKDRKNALRRERYANDPEYRARIMGHNKKWSAGHKDESSAAHRQWYASLSEEEKQKQRGRKQEWLRSQSLEKQVMLRRRATEKKLEKRNLELKRAVDLLGGCCKACGLVDDPCIYDFHHLRDKEYTLGSMFSNKPWSLIETELSKCVLLCALCHRKVHKGLIKLAI